MPPAGGRADPFASFNFIVEINGIQAASFAEVSGLESETAVIEYRTGADLTLRKLPGLTKYTNITLKRGVTQDYELWNWRKAVVNGTADRRDGSVVLLDGKRNEVLRWNFFEAWPCRWVGPGLNAKSNEVAIETLELAVERIELA
ncbi:MAG: phage tail protein [Actinomycetota bacterium]|nr:phage tail protein [Actinomycetota bacterium]